MKLIKTSILFLFIGILHSCGGAGSGSNTNDSTTSASTFTKLYGSSGTNTYGYSVTSNLFYNLVGVGTGLDGASTGDSFATLSNSSGTYSWVKQFGAATGATSTNNSTARGGASDLIITGSTSGNLDGNTKTGSQDMFISSYDYNKNLLWTKLLGIAGAATNGNGVACYGNINCYVVGTTGGNLSGQAKTGTTDIFITKYSVSSSSASLVWTKLLGVSGGTTTGLRIAVSSDGNSIYAVGSTNGNLDGQTKTGSTDIFVTKYDSSGNKIWTKLLGASGAYSSGNSIAVNASAVYVVGLTHGAIGSSTQVSTVDGFIASLNLTTGNVGWSKQIGGSQPSSSTLISDIVLDSSGKIYVSGSTTGSLPGNTIAGTNDGFVASYTSSGFSSWITQKGISAKDTWFTSIDYDDYTYLYIGGYTNGNLDGKTLTGISDGLIMKYGTDGTKF